MEHKGATARTFGIIAIVLLGLTIAFGLCSYLYVTRESQYLTERNLRELNRLDSVLKARIENYTNKVLPNLVAKAAKDYQNHSPLCDVEAAEHPGKSAAPDADLFTSYLLCAMKPAPNLGLVGKAVFTPQPISAPQASVDPRQEDDAFNIYIAYKGPEGQERGVSFRAVLRMEDLLRGHRGDVFDDLFIASLDKSLDKSKDGRVIFQRATGELRLDELPPLNETSGKSAAGQSDMPGGSSPPKVAASGVFPVRLGGTDYKLFIHPLRLVLLGGTASNTEWALCALVTAARFRQESWAISNPLLLLFLFAFALVITGYPLLKLWGLGPTEQLGKADALLACVSVLMVSSLLTYFLLDVYAYRHLQKELDGQLREFAHNIQEHFAGELQQLCKMLNDMNHAMAPESSGPKKEIIETSVLCQGKDCKRPAWIDDESPYFQNTAVVHPDGMQFAKWAIDKVSGPAISVRQRAYFQTINQGLGWRLPNNNDQLFFLDSVLSWNTGDPQAVLAIPWMNHNQTQGVSTVIAKLISLQQTVIPPGFGYAVIENSGKVMFHSEARLAQADFFQECDGDRELRSLVFARIDKVIDVRCAGRYFRLYTLPLEGLPWTMVTFKDWEPVQTANLELLSASLILGILYAVVFLFPVLWLCFRRREWLWPDEQRSLDYGILLLANLALIVGLVVKDFLLVPHHHAPAAAFVIPPFALLLNCLKLKGAKPARWTEHPSFVLLLALPILLLGLGWANGEVVTPHGYNLERSGCLSLALLMCAALAFVFFTPRSCVKTVETYSCRPELRSGSSYLCMALSIVVLVSILPALAFFRSAHDNEMEVVVKHSQYRIARSFAERTQRISQEYQDVPKPPDFIEKRLQADSDVYTSFFYNTGPGEVLATVESDELHFFDRLMEVIRPLYSDAGVETHELLRDASADSSAKWQPVQWRPVLQSDQTQPAPVAGIELTASTNLQLFSSVPLLRWPNTLGCWLVLLLAAPVFLFSIYALLRWMAERIVLFGLRVPALSKIAVCDLGTVTENTLVLGTPHSGKSKLLARPDFFLVDLRLIASANSWDEALKQELPKDRAVIAIDHLEYEMRNPECNIRKLALLEKFLYSNRTLVVASIADPMDFPIATGTGEKVDDATGNQNTKDKKSGVVDSGSHDDSIDADRWAAFWSTFTRKTYAAKEESAANNEEALKQAVSQAKLRAPSAIALLRECRSTERLRQIGIAISVAPGHDQFDVEQVIAEVLDRARAYYRALWATCSKEEKSALFDMARDGFANSKNCGLHHLLERGLAVRKPELRCLNESFRRFVLETGLREGLPDLGADEWSHWKLIRSTLLFMLVGGGLVVYLTQPQLLNTSSAFIGAIAAGIPALLKVFDLLRGTQTKAG